MNKRFLQTFLAFFRFFIPVHLPQRNSLLRPAVFANHIFSFQNEFCVIFESKVVICTIFKCQAQPSIGAIAVDRGTGNAISNFSRRFVRATVDSGQDASIARQPNSAQIDELQLVQSDEQIRIQTPQVSIPVQPQLLQSPRKRSQRPSPQMPQVDETIEMQNAETRSRKERVVVEKSEARVSAQPQILDRRCGKVGQGKARRSQVVEGGVEKAQTREKRFDVSGGAETGNAESQKVVVADVEMKEGKLSFPFTV